MGVGMAGAGDRGPARRPAARRQAWPVDLAGRKGTALILHVTGRQLDVTDAIRDYAQRRVDKLGKYLEPLRNADVVLEKRGPHTYWVEMIVRVNGFAPFVGTEKGDDLYAAVDTCANKLERQVREFHARLVDHKHAG
jgi:putative sigma-54 modulation protein